MSGAARGVDVSSWQHPGQAPIDWWAVAEEGYTFALVKVSQGISYVNPWAARDLDDARAAGLLVGAYHFYEPGYSAELQAKHFVGSLIGELLELGTWLDFEPGPMPAYQAQTELGQFLLAANDGRPGTGLYIDLAWYEELKAISFTFPRLWLADWTQDKPNVGQLIWQDAISTVKGISGPVDVDVLTSTRGVNLPTAPAPKPNALTARSMVPDEVTSPQSPPVNSDVEDEGEQG
jgi:GH25 family lysozyme M1 (1,4-beta-N-acetylmuramidase)